MKTEHGNKRGLYPVRDLVALTDIELRTLYGHVLKELEYRTCGDPRVCVSFVLPEVKKEESKLG